MIKEQTLANFEEKDTNVVNFEEVRKGLLTGGPNGPENWLQTLPVGTVFLTKRKNAPKDIIYLDLYAVLDRKENTTNLMQKIPDGRQVDLWFETLAFSRLNTLVETIATMEFGYEKLENQKALEEGPDEKETADGTSDRPV